MDIPALSTAMAASKVSQQQSVSMMKKALEQVELQGEQFVDMVESTNVITATKLDVKI